MTTLTSAEREAVAAARKRCRAFERHQAKPRPAGMSKKPMYRGQTCDDVLREHGITVGYKRGEATYATIFNAICDGEELPEDFEPRTPRGHTK